MTLAVLRDGARIEKQVTLSERGGDAEAPRPSAAPPPDAWPGLELADWKAPADPDDAAHGLIGVRVSEVAPTSPWYEQGVRAGNVVSEIDGRAVKSVAELEQALAGAKRGSYVRLYVWRVGRGGPATATFVVARVP